MTKYVLNSGGLRNNPKKAAEYTKEIIRGLGKKPKILIVPWARLREDWEAKFADDQVQMPKKVPDVELQLELAMPETFAEQVERNDVVLVHGGDDHLIRYWFDQFDMKKLLDGKVYAGSSAGADVVVTSYWTCDWRKVMDGMGLVPIKFIPHFNSDYGADDPRGPVDWQNAKQRLEKHGEDLPIHALKEGHFVVIDQ